MMFKSLTVTAALVLASQVQCTGAFVSPAVAAQRSQQSQVSPFGDVATISTVQASSSSSSTSLQMAKKLQPGDPVMLVGPGFLQLVIAKHAKAAGLRPIVVAPQAKLDSFFTNILLDEEIKNDSTIGMPENGDPYFGELKGVVFCAEDAILPSDFINRVLDFTHEGKSAFADSEVTRAICLLPVEDKIQKEKTSSWIPIFNNDRTVAMNWKNFKEKFMAHPVWKNDVGSIIRFGSVFGGSTDGAEFLKDLGLEEGMYKMSLEQYRDLRERAFDRYRLGAQVLEGNGVNPKPANQDKMEAEFISKKYGGEIREAFNILGAYPEQDRACRHTVAAAVIQSLMQEVGQPVPKEMTILSKAVSELPTSEEWDEMFKNPGPAAWPDPFTFSPEQYDLEVKK